MSISDRPRPLPECALCSSPTQRRVHRANKGMCTDCARVYATRNADQQALLFELEQPAPRPPDLSNVVVLDTRRGRTR